MDTANAKQSVSSLAAAIREEDRDGAQRKSGSSVNVSELLEAIIDEFGGVVPLARQVVRLAQDGSVSAHTRAKMLDMTARLVAIETRRMGAEKTDESQMPYEDMELQLKRLMQDADDPPAPQA